MADHIPTPPTQADARDAMETLGPDTLEDTATPAVAYLQARLTEHRADPLWGRDTAMIVAAVALAVRAYIAQPVIARWDSSAVSDDATGETSVLCTTDTGQPVALQLNAEDTEALAGILLDTDDGEQVDPCACGTASIVCACGDTRCPSCDPTCQQQSPTYRDGVRDALAAAAREAERANPYAGPAALATAIRMMGTAGPLAQDGPVQVHDDDGFRDRIAAAIERKIREHPMPTPKPWDPPGMAMVWGCSFADLADAVLEEARRG